MADLGRYLVDPEMTIRAVMAGLGETAGIALVVNQERQLIATVTDGDVRRAILAGIDLDRPVRVLTTRQRDPQYSIPVTAPVETPSAQFLQIMTDNEIRHLPLIDSDGRVVDIVMLQDLIKDYELPMTAVVMAGGFGTRLRPLTDDIPKPMLPVGDKPLLEHIVDQLRTAGVKTVNITTHYKGDVIAKHFRDGRDFGMDIRYVDEAQPLGTAGALSLVEPSDEPVLVINGDIITRVDLRAMLNFHDEHRAEMTVAVRQHETQVPYGVVRLDGVDISNIVEKPVQKFLINAGIYLISPQACRKIPVGRKYDMPDLIRLLLAEGHRVIGFPIQEYWLDIGRVDDYARAQADIKEGELTV